MRYFIYFKLSWPINPNFHEINVSILFRNMRVLMWKKILLVTTSTIFATSILVVFMVPRLPVNISGLYIYYIMVNVSVSMLAPKYLINIEFNIGGILKLNVEAILGCNVCPMLNCNKLAMLFQD